MSYDAEEITNAMSLAQSLSRRIGVSVNIIDRGGKLEVVQTTTSSDKVVVQNITAPRHTRALIGACCEAGEEIERALPFIERAAALIKAKQGTNIEADEIVADLLRGACDWVDAKQPPSGKRPFTKIFGRAFF